MEVENEVTVSYTVQRTTVSFTKSFLLSSRIQEGDYIYVSEKFYVTVKNYSLRGSGVVITQGCYLESGVFFTDIRISENDGFAPFFLQEVESAFKDWEVSGNLDDVIQANFRRLELFEKK
jgi:hypothetical protein